MEGNENFGLVIDDSSLPSHVIRGSPGTVTVNMVDDDSKLKLKNTIMYEKIRSFLHRWLDDYIHSIIATFIIIQKLAYFCMEDERF